MLPAAGLQPPACAGQPLPAAITGRYAQAGTLVARAAQSGRVKQSQRLVGKAARVLRAAARQATAPGKHARLSPACASALAATLQEAAGRAAALAAAL